MAYRLVGDNPFIRTNAEILSIGHLSTTPTINFSGISIEIHTFSFTKLHLKMSSAKWRAFCLGLNVLIDTRSTDDVYKGQLTGS